MNRMKRRIVTLLIAVFISIYSLINAIISYVLFWETDNYIYTKNDYENYGLMRSIFIILTIIFICMFLYILYMLFTYRGKLYDKLFYSYKIVGIINLFDIIPDFVYVIVKRNGKYYFQEDNYERNGKAGVLKRVSPVKSDFISKIKPLSEFGFQTSDFKTIIIGDEAIEAFQYEKDKLIIGTRIELNEFFLTYKACDETLKDQIDNHLREDFKNN